MTLLHGRALRAALACTSILAGATLVAPPVAAQTTTASVRGRVLGPDGAPAAGVEVTATSIATGSVTRATTNATGAYSLSALQPGDYRFEARGGAGVASSTARVQVGQNATLDLTLGVAAAEALPTDDATSAAAGDVVVTAQLQETATQEVATNVTSQQIENLPQNNRNFLNFAALAPGIRVNQTEFRQTFSGGGVGADRNGDSFGGPQVNVFIDGVSLRSNINQGGVVGQDVSRGNPFSQLAVQEFRVLTSNFKAEYEDAGTAIITAVTKSGTNDFHGEAFGTYQDQSLIERDYLQKRDNLDEPKLKRYQFGAALGGPIVRDKLFFFANYEGNIQDRAQTVVPGGGPADYAQLSFDVDDYRGTFSSPFREHLGFAKLNWQIDDDQALEISGSLRKETDLRDFGGQAAQSRGSRVKNDVYTGKLRHQWTANGFLNEATVDYLKSNLRFGAIGDNGFGQTYQGILQIGGRADQQAVRQESVTFRDNVTLDRFEAAGNHVVRFGVKISRQHYEVGGTGPNANPQFEFQRDATRGLDFSFPALVNFGGGDPNVTANTTQIGLFAQDDWDVNPHLTINLGVRWDYDSNFNNRKFEIAPAGAAALRALGADPRIQPSFFDVEDYISDGSRKRDLNNFAPRVGFSYDINADQQTVLFGGYGRYYDRALFRSAAEETLLRQYRSGQLLFSRDGAPRDGRPTVAFRNEYLTPEGFQALLASLAADPISPGTSELRVIPNDLKTPYTDQFSVGVRQRFGALRTSLTYNYTIGRDQIGYAPLNRSTATDANGFYTFIPLINGYSNAVAAFNTRRTRYHAAFLQIDKPYTPASGYGFGIAYTLAFSKERGFGFNFDFPNISDRPYVPNAGDERHRVVGNWIIDLPLDFRFSGLATIGSGAPFAVIDASQGFGARDIRLRGNVGSPVLFAQVDLKLQKNIKVFDGGEFQVWGEVFNVFNRANITSDNGFIPRLPETNASFGRPNILVGPPRSFQFGAAFRF